MATKKTVVKDVPEDKTDELNTPQAFSEEIPQGDDLGGDGTEPVDPVDPVDPEVPTDPEPPVDGGENPDEPTGPSYPTPVAGTVARNQKPWAEALTAEGYYLTGTGIESTGSSVIDDGVVQLALAPLNANVHHLVYADGGYTLDDPSGDVSCTFALTTRYPEAFSDYVFSLQVLVEGVRVKTLELRDGKWTDPEDPAYVLTDSVVTDQTIQNTTRATWFQPEGAHQSYVLQAEHVLSGSRIEVSADVTIKAVPVDPTDKVIYPPNLPGEQYENYRVLNLGGRTSAAVVMAHVRAMCPTKPMPNAQGARLQEVFYRALVGILNQPADVYENGMDLLLDVFNTYGERALGPTHALRFLESVRLAKADRNLFEGLVSALILLAPVQGRKEIFSTYEPRLEKLFIESSQVTNLRLEAWDNFKRYFA